MAESFGPGVTRTLSAFFRQFQHVVWQKGKPPLDSELSLMSQIHREELRQHLHSLSHSGFMFDPTRSLSDYQFNPLWSNFFALGKQKSGELDSTVWANVNGWIIPVDGTNTTISTDVRNIIKMYPAPESDTRADLIFLEVWQSLVAPNPSTANKPSASKIWKYGNVSYGGTNIDDDLQDPAIGFETTKRVQIQYRIRVFGQGSGLGSGIALDVYPDGLGDPNVYGQGNASAPVAGFPYINMREELGDPSLWRAGNGTPSNALSSVDGYSYAIPICAVFRRNSGTFVAVNSAGNPNQNGSFDRNPSAITLSNPLDGAKTLTQVTLVNAITPTTTGVVQVNNLIGSGIDDASHSISVSNPLFLVIDGEIIAITAIDTGAAPNTITIPASLGRGRWATDAVGHAAGASVNFFNERPDNKFSDQIGESDILDLRRCVSPDGWDYQRLLMHNVASLVNNELRSTWKQSGIGDTEGVTVVEVDSLFADGATAVPNQTEAIDGPDGIRTIFSDAATIQPQVTVMCDNDAPLTNGFTSTNFDATVAWDVGAEFKPTGFVNNEGAPGSFRNGSTIFLHIGGLDGTLGARSTFRDGSTKAVRFLSPQETWVTGHPTFDPTIGNQHPIQLRFLKERALSPPAFGEPAADIIKHPGPLYPWRELNFESPFIALGGLLNPNLQITGLASNAVFTNGPPFEIDLGVDFSVANSWFAKGGGAAATGTITVDNAFVTLGDTVTVNGTTLTTGVDFLIGATSADTATNLAAAITGLVPTVSATSSGPIVNLIADTVGIAGNNITLSSSNIVAFSIVNPFLSGGVDNDFLNDPSAITNPLLRDQKTLYGMLTNNGKDRTGDSSAVYVVLYGDDNAGARNNNGAFKVVGVGTSLGVGLTNINASNNTSIVVEPLSADFSTFNTASAGSVSVEFRSQITNSEDGAGSTTGPSALAIVLTDIAGVQDHPWNATTLGAFALSDTQTDKLVISTTLQYHPGRGGAARVPEDIWRFSVVGAGAEYLRQSPSSIDTSFAAQTGVPSNETFWDINHVQTWNRLTSLGHISPFAPDYGGNVVSFSEQDREAELFIDKGSKTILFRPFQDEQMTLQAIQTSANPSLIGSTSYGASAAAHLIGAAKDPHAMFTTNKKMAYPVPPEYVPRFGRQDIPHFTDIASGGGTFLQGINHLFTDSIDATKPVFEVIGGEDNTSGGNLVKPIFFQTGGPNGYGRGNSSIGAVASRPNLEARKTTDIGTLSVDAKAITEQLAGVVSSDLGAGLKGIQLPPYYGPARVYGVYDRADYISSGGATFNPDRVTVAASPATNLLKLGADKQTLFLLRNGAKDATGEDGDHTYIIPEQAFDITKSPNYVAGNTFEDFDYVVECVVFGFAKDWINCNNYVMSRLHNGQGTLRDEATQPLLEEVNMTIPSAASLNDQAYLGYNRTVYQGDPFMTRAGASRTVSDYEHRYGQISTVNANQLKNPIQQYDANGNSNIEIPNARTLEVLAAVDFYTTLGSGSIGGRLYPGTPLDVGFTQNTSSAASRIPAEPTDPAWRILPRAFTEGQKGNSSRSQAVLEFLNADSTLLNAEVKIYPLAGNPVTMVAKNLASYNSFNESEFLIDEILEGSIFPVPATVIPSLGFTTLVASIPGTSMSDIVLINTEATWDASSSNRLVISGIATATDTVTITIANPTAGAIPLPVVPLTIKVFPQTATVGPVDALTNKGVMEGTARNLAARLNAHSQLRSTLTATSNGTNSVVMTAKPVGSEGNNIEVEVRRGLSPILDITTYLKLASAITNSEPPGAKRTRINFSGGVDTPVNAGNGTSIINLTGMTERFPLGILLQDSDFLGENPLGTGSATAMQTSPAGIRPIQTSLPLTTGGEEFTRFINAPGTLIGMADGGILQYTPYHAADSPTGSKRFRLYRGGGSAFVLSGKNPGGPIDWVSDSLSASLLPVLKGGVLACKALLVRDYVENAFSTGTRTSEGDEIFMVLITMGLLGNGMTQTQGVSIEGVISPTGYGEGYAASDRYRLNGKPMYKDHTREVTDPNSITLAVFPGAQALGVGVGTGDPCD